MKQETQCNGKLFLVDLAGRWALLIVWPCSILWYFRSGFQRMLGSGCTLDQEVSGKEEGWSLHSPAFIKPNLQRQGWLRQRVLAPTAAYANAADLRNLQFSNSCLTTSLRLHLPSWWPWPACPGWRSPALPASILLRDPLWDAMHTLTSWKRGADQDCRIAMGYYTSMELKQHTFSQVSSCLQEDDMRSVE